MSEPAGVRRLGSAVLIEGDAVGLTLQLVSTAVRVLTERNALPPSEAAWRLQSTLRSALVEQRSSPSGSPHDTEAALWERMVGSKEAQVILGNVSARQVRNLAGTLGGRKVGNVLLFDRALVEAEAERRELEDVR